MGFFDKLRELGDIVKESRDDWRENVAPTFREGGEVFTDGFKEMVIKGNKDYQTSYEKMDTANAIIEDEKKRFETTSRDVKTYYEQTNQLVKDHYKYKQALHKEVVNKHQHIIADFVTMSIDAKKLDDSTRSVFSQVASGLTVMKSSSAFPGAGFLSGGIASVGRLNPVLMGISAASWVFEKNERVKSANEHLENAKAFRAEVGVKIGEVKALKTRLKLIQAKVKEEKRLLMSLISKLEYITSNLASLMDQQKLSADEAKRAEASVLIANAINETLTSKFLTESGNLTTSYKRALMKLKDVEKLLAERGI